MEKRGRFIAFEGIDGSGKTTQIEYLMKKLQKLGVKCLETCEPTGLAAGRLCAVRLQNRLSLTTEQLRRFLLPTGLTTSQTKKTVF